MLLTNRSRRVRDLRPCSRRGLILSLVAILATLSLAVALLVLPATSSAAETTATHRATSRSSLAVRSPISPTAIQTQRQNQLAAAMAQAQAAVQAQEAAEYQAQVAAWVAGVQRAQLLAAQQRAATAQRQARQRAQAPRPQASAAPRSGGVSGQYASVAACVKDHESGNYGESSHPGSGSGAYQFIPSTWRTWSAKAGYGGYAYAYQAPAAVQDAVFEYALSHGGAHNWDNAYGNDPCTESLP